MSLAPTGSYPEGAEGDSQSPLGGRPKRMFLRNEANKSFACNETAGQEAPRDDVQPGLHQREKRSSPFSALLYSLQVGQAFLPALERTGLEACPYFGGYATPTLKMA